MKISQNSTGSVSSAHMNPDANRIQSSDRPKAAMMSLPPSEQGGATSISTRQGNGNATRPSRDVTGKGTVKFFNTTKGYGLIRPHDGSKDVFVHISAVQSAGLNHLNDGQNVNYDEMMEKGKTAASNIKLA